MQVLCPSCETAYEIPSLQRPRKLRCARCASEWRVLPEPVPATVEAPGFEIPGLEVPGLETSGPNRVGLDGSVLEREPAAATHPGPEGAPAPPGALLAEQPLSPPATPHRNTASGVRLGRDDLVIGLLWLLSAVLIVATLSALWHWRVTVSHRWPPSLRLYRLLPDGVPPPRIPPRRLPA